MTCFREDWPRCLRGKLLETNYGRRKLFQPCCLSMSSRYMMHIYTQTHVGHIWSTHGTRVVFIFTSTHLKRTHSVNHGAHSHFYIFGTGRVHTETHTRHAYANLYGHTWIHIKQLHTCRACANRTHTCRAQRYTVRDAPALKTHTPISQIHTPKDLLGQTTLSP